MKTNIFSIILAMVSVAGFSATHTVDNKAGSAAQFADLQTAIDAAQVGDTILVAPSPDGYGSVTIKKKLTLIGGGYTGLRTDVAYMYLENFNSGSGSSGTYISGFDVGRIYFDPDYTNRPSGTSASLSGYIIERNQIGTLYFTQIAGDENWNFSNITIRNNIITLGLNLGPNSSSSYSDNSYTGLLVSNNIFSGAAITSQVSISTNNGVPYIDFYQSTSGVSIQNNIFINSSYVFEDIRGAVVENNIFYAVNPIPESDYADQDTLNYSINFNNNITYQTPQDLTANSWFAVGANNVDMDPLYVDFPIDGAGFSIEHDYHLQAGSPGLGAGVNGEDLGIYGGTYPWPASLSAKPKGPVMGKVEAIGSPSVPAGGTLEIRFNSSIEE